MALRVDLSSTELKPELVTHLLKGHVSDPPSQDIVFKINQNVFKSLLKKKPKTAVEVSPEEAAEINSFLGAQHKTSDYTLWKRWSHFLRQPVKVDSPMQRMNHHEDAETVFG